MTEFTCSECEKDFEAPFPYGDNIQCPHCKIWLLTDAEYDIEDMHAWVIGKIEDKE